MARWPAIPCSKRFAPSGGGWRARRAIPPYVIFHDSTLRAIAEARPGSLDELARLPGIGAAKLDRYGAAMLAVVRDIELAGPNADRGSMVAQ